MILFYSDYCKHCNVLLETIKRHDKNNIVKLVSVDTLRSLNKAIDPSIHSVPALFISNTKEYMFGKSVFDHLLLPNRGVLFNNNIREVGNKGENKNVTIDNKDANKTLDEPSAFSIGSIYSESFSSLDDENLLNDKNYKWDIIDNLEVSIKSQVPVEEMSSGGKKNLPSMEDIMKQRAIDLV